MRDMARDRGWGLGGECLYLRLPPYVTLTRLLGVDGSRKGPTPGVRSSSSLSRCSVERADGLRGAVRRGMDLVGIGSAGSPPVDMWVQVGPAPKVSEVRGSLGGSEALLAERWEVGNESSRQWRR